MKKNGFTLAEMLGVIIILALLALVVFPTVANLIKSSKDKSYQEQVNYITDAASNWIVENASTLSKTGYKCLSVADLKSSGFLESKSIIDPRDNSEMSGYVKITYNASYNQFEKEYVTSCS